MTELTLPSVDVALHELRQMVIREELASWAYQRISIAARAATDTTKDQLYRESWAHTGSAVLLEFGATFPEGVFPSLAAAILQKGPNR